MKESRRSFSKFSNSKRSPNPQIEPIQQVISPKGIKEKQKQVYSLLKNHKLHPRGLK